jgi:hypothetical protein
MFGIGRTELLLACPPGVGSTGVGDMRFHAQPLGAFGENQTWARARDEVWAGVDRGPERA